MSQSEPAPHGSTQTPVDGRFKRDGGGQAAVTTAAASGEAKAAAAAAAPQPQDVEPRDGERVQQEVRRLAREFSAHLPSPAEPASGAPPRRDEEKDKAKEKEKGEEELREAATKQQAGDDQSVGAADAGLAAVALAEGALSAAARKLGFGQQEEA